jgi:hypothetical protein
VALLNRIRSVAFSPSLLIPLSVATIVFVAAYDNASYSLPSRNTLAIAVWWTVIIGAALRTLTLEGVTRASLVIGGLIAALCTWTFASVFWAPSAENAFNEFNRVSLFLAIFVFTTLAVRRGSILRWCDGLAIGISLVALVALTSRFFPGSFSDQGLGTFLHSLAPRLSFPLGYWNGLAIFVALGLPLLLRIATSSVKPVVRGLAVAPIPAIASVVFLASSRGGIVTGFVGVVVFLLLTERRWVASAALLWGAVGSAIAIVVLDSYNELVNGPLGTRLVEREGRSATLIVALSCVFAGAGYAAGREATSRLAQRRTFRPKPWLGRATVALVVGIFVLGIAASHPVRQFQAFERPPGIIPTSDFAAKHLRSGSGSGRWQFWAASIDQWESHPLLGNGAGSYEAWWTKHMPADYPQPAKDAHSLYIESLGELGIPGFALALSLALAGIGIGVRRSLRSAGERRVALATLTAVFAAFSVATGIDWMWELTVVAGLGIVALALLSSAAATAQSPPQLVSDTSERRYARQRRFGLGVAALIGVWLLICAQGIPLLSQLRIKDSQAYDRNGGKATEALQAAMDARNLQPWASGPYLQLALVSENEGLIDRAHGWIESAIARDSTNWQLWLVAARLDVKLGDIRGAEQSLNRAKSLNPKSPLFAG